VAATAGACIDSFVATSPTGPVTTSICGTNTNQHSKNNSKHLLLNCILKLFSYNNVLFWLMLQNIS